MLTVIDEYTHESLAIKTKRRLNSTDVLDCLNDLFLSRGVPEHIRSDNGAEFTAIAVEIFRCDVGVYDLDIRKVLRSKCSDAHARANQPRPNQR